MSTDPAPDSRALHSPQNAQRAAAPPQLRLIALPDFPVVQVDDDLAALTMAALSRAGLDLHSDDVLVYAQKIVSKAEGRRVALCSVSPGARALQLAQVVQKDARLVELVLREARRVVRAAKDVLIVEDRRGLVMANAGIDQSNVADADAAAGEQALLLPEDPDASAARLAARLGELAGLAAAPAVIISDSFGRPWRLGTVGVAIGCAGLASLLDLRGQQDLFGRALRVTVVGHADELAAAASLVMGQADEGRPVVLVRGLGALQGVATRTASGSERHRPASALIRPAGEDLFR
ncbi:MAG TPA: coenzyme F420-0:L-glutamate ligase [Steroidobacteraceae bacterium]|jgi:coenzyme F420-0:L-glutamate ligase/coenzyme F420-1:gamma-L-glutamate ligase|nr:coenzyme F420-0:L-glutamate ligase [Steroidobacteraceae bacterium]